VAIMGDWEIRPASVADVEAVAELRAIVLRADLDRLGRYDAQRVRQWLRLRLRLRDGFGPSCTTSGPEAPNWPWPTASHRR
jgi:hypothetical protein